MAKGYFIGNIDITDPEGYAQYKALVSATVAKFDGRYLVRGGAMEAIEGDAPLPRSVVLEFPNVAQAKAWYHSADYQAIVGLRLAASTGHAFIVEGV